MRAERPGEMMKLGAFFHPTGNHVAAWLHPDAQIYGGTNYRHYAALARTAERGKFDLMLLADAADGKLAAPSRWLQYMVFFDPVTLLSAIAPVTQRNASSSVFSSARYKDGLRSSDAQSRYAAPPKPARALRHNREIVRAPPCGRVALMPPIMAWRHREAAGS